ncbi:MAG: hypothetical protein EA364_04030 [Balneolaceae bacterium]|nr:MAG: hypothetical protein EA364_04030 [Balneolaceae bacterium]
MAMVFQNSIIPLLLPVIAGDFIRFTPGEIYAVALIISLPGIILSVPVLWSRMKRNRAVFVTLMLVWILLMPWIVLIVVNGIEPGILARSHAYSTIGYYSRVFLPGILMLPALAWLISLMRKKDRG